MSVLPNEGNPLGNGGPAGNPNPSQPQGQPLEAQLQQAISQLNNLQGEVNALKSGKDKAVGRAEAAVQESKDAIAKIASYLNVTPEQVLEAQRKSVLDDLVHERLNNSQPVVQQPSQVQEPTGAKVELSDIDKTLELPANDPRLTALKVVYANDPAAYAIKAGELKASLNQSSPTPAEIPVNIQPVAQQRTPTNNALQQEYETRRDAIMQEGLRTDARIEKLTDLKAEMRGKGLQLR